MELQKVTPLIVVLVIFLVGCTTNISSDDLSSKPTPTVAPNLVGVDPSKIPTVKPAEHTELDPNWTDSVQQMSERQVIATAHGYMNYLWCDDNKLEIKGDPVEIFQALQDRWNSFTFDLAPSLSNDEFLLNRNVNESLDLAKKGTYIGGHKKAHRIMHQLDLWVLRSTPQEFFVERYGDYTSFQDDQLKDWRK